MGERESNMCSFSRYFWWEERGGGLVNHPRYVKRVQAQRRQTLIRFYSMNPFHFTFYKTSFLDPFTRVFIETDTPGKCGKPSFRNLTDPSSVWFPQRQKALAAAIRIGIVSQQVYSTPTRVWRKLYTRGQRKGGYVCVVISTLQFHRGGGWGWCVSAQPIGQFFWGFRPRVSVRVRFPRCIRLAPNNLNEPMFYFCLLDMGRWVYARGKGNRVSYLVVGSRGGLW